jgi:hypothetical protein
VNANRCMPKRCALGLVIGLSVFVVGCATGPQSKTHPSYYQLSDVIGKWSWTQNPWHGDFVLKMDGDSCAGTLNDVYEGTYGDRIKDVTISDNHIKFTRTGKFGTQQWEGTLKRKGWVLRIIDGRWTKDDGDSGSFTAQKKI